MAGGGQFVRWGSDFHLSSILLPSLEEGSVCVCLPILVGLTTGVCVGVYSECCLCRSSLHLPRQFPSLSAGPPRPGGGARIRPSLSASAAGSGRPAPVWVYRRTLLSSSSLPVSLSSPSLEKLLQPVISVLLSACSRPYLSPHTLILSLSTLNSLLSIFLSGSSLTSDFWQGLSLWKQCQLSW